MPGIFLSYRRVDSAPYAGRLYDHLTAHFGRDQVFMDIDTIKPGVDFVEVLEDAVEKCDALVAVIGKQWVSVTDAEGRRRLDDPYDFTRLEVAHALQRSIRVIPVLVDGASMPRAADLPDDLTKLSRHNALTVSNERFGYDVGKLISALDEVLQSVSSPSKTESQPAASLADVKPWNQPISPEKKAPAIKTPTVKTESEARQRGPLLSGYLVIVILLIAFGAYACLPLALNSYLEGENVFRAISLCLFLSALGVYGMWRWKKWGVYLLAASSVLIAIFVGGLYLQLVSEGNTPAFTDILIAPVVLLMGTGVLWFVLKNKWQFFEGKFLTVLGRTR